MISFLLVMAFLSPGEAPVVTSGKARPPVKTMTFTEDLRIGPSTDEAHLEWIGNRVMVDVDSRGHMYILDAVDNQILVFDETGKFIRTLGGTGKGPGEFEWLTNFSVLNDDGVMVYESRIGVSVITHFDRDGKVVSRSTPVADGMFLQAAVPSYDGQHFMGMYIAMLADGSAMLGGTALFNPELKAEKKLMDQKLKAFSPSGAEKSQWWQEYLAEWLNFSAKQSVVSFDRDGHVWVANVDQYRVTRHDAALTPDLVIEKEYKPRFQTESELAALVSPFQDELMTATDSMFHRFLTEETVAKAMEKSDLPPRKPPIYGLVPTGDGRVLVVHTYDLESRKASADLFEADGSYAGSVELPPVSVNMFGTYMGHFVKMTIRNGFAYVLNTDDDDNQWLVRYRIGS